MEKRYELKTVTDFFNVPEEKRAHCLEDFRLWLDVIGGMTELFGGIGGIRANRATFLWIDDGKHDAEVSIDVVNNRSEQAQEPAE